MSPLHHHYQKWILKVKLLRFWIVGIMLRECYYSNTKGKMKKLVILGRESGIGALLLKKNKYDVFVSDKGIITEKSVLSNNNIRWEEGVHTKHDILSATEVVKSPEFQIL